jgi:hypothetical protein
VRIRQDRVETDIHPFAAGITFDQDWTHRVRGAYGKEEVFYTSLDE